MRKFIYSLGLIMVLVSCGKKTETESGQDEERQSTVKIGAVYPLTGNGAQYGEYFRMGTELAYKYAVSHGIVKSHEIQFVYEDGQGDATKSINALNKLISTQEISGCLTDLSSVLLPIKPIVNREKILTINSSSFSSNIEDADDYMYSILPNADSYAKQIAEYSYHSLNKRNAVVIYRNDDMGVSFDNVFSEAFTDLGGKIVFAESHEKGATDYSSIVRKLTNLSEADIIFCASYGVEAARLIKQLSESNYSNQYITFQGFIIPDVFDIAGNSIDGTIVLGSNFTSLDNETTVKLSKLSSELFNISELNFYTAAHFDAAMMFIDAVAKGNNSGEEIKEFFDDPSYSYAGITGTFRFNENGLVDTELVPYRVGDGKFNL